MIFKINKNASNIHCYHSSRTNDHTQVNSSLIHESKELKLTYNRGDTLVHNTNNSNSCLSKHLALKCQVGAPYTAQNMVASLDLSTLDSSSDRFTTNFETYGTVTHESHNYVYSSLSYFSDISDHNSQVASINKYEKSQANEFEDCTIGIQSHYVVGQGITSQLGRHSMGSEFSHIVPNANNNTMFTQVIKCAEEYEHKKPLVCEFGFIPETIPVIHYAAKNQGIEFRNASQWLHDIHEAVRNTNKPNYQNARIAVPSGLQVPAWRQLIKDYDLKILAEYVEFGFPLGVDYQIFQFSSFTKNHASALLRPQGVDKYFKVEKEKNLIYGPFKNSPFNQTHYSPLMARDKPDGGVRIIVDLSWPIGQSVNSCVATDIYDNIPFKLQYPTIDQVVQKIQEYGPTCLLYKVDLERAFRNLKVDPLYYPLLGLCWWNETFIDVSVPFGFKFGAAACQMCTDLVTFTLRKRGSWLINYLDDYIGVAPPALANSHFQALLNILQYVGLPINMKKVEEPNNKITCLGIQIDALTGILKIPEVKMQEVVKLCQKWATQTHATKNQLQKLTGKLLYIHRCVKPARIFINRILAVLRNAPHKGVVQLPSAFFRDINWCNRFL